MVNDLVDWLEETYWQCYFTGYSWLYLTVEGDRNCPRFAFLAVPRSSTWAKVKKEHLRHQPCCRACGRKRRLAVHHIKPYHLFPELELDPTNLMTLCRHCHLVFGHFGNFKAFNPNAVRDAINHNLKLRKFIRYAA